VVPRPVSGPIEVGPDTNGPGSPAPPPGAGEVLLRRVGPGGSWASDSAFGVALVTLWHRVAEAGGAVGFARPVTRAEVAAVVAPLVDDLRSGRLVGFAVNRGRTLVGVGLLRPGRGATSHTGELVTVLVDPQLRGRGSGTLLMDALLGAADELGLERIQASVRDGDELPAYFAQFGFTVWGRRPGWIRLGPAEYGDEIILGADVRSAEVGQAEVGQAEVGQAEVGQAEVGQAEVGQAELRTAEPRTTR